MSAERLEAYLDRMIVTGNKAVRYVSGLDHQAFRLDEIKQDAVIANVMAIGECATKIMERFPDFVVEHPEIPGKTSAICATALRINIFTWISTRSG